MVKWSCYKNGCQGKTGTVVGNADQSDEKLKDEIGTSFRTSEWCSLEFSDDCVLRIFPPEEEADGRKSSE